MAIKQANGVNITIVERKDEFVYNELISSFISNHIEQKTNSNFLKVNPAETSPTVITRFISGGLQGKINKLIILQCSDLKVLECKMGDSKLYKGKIPTLFDELCRILPNYRNVKVIVSVSEINKNSKVFKKVDTDGKIIYHEQLGLRQLISFVNKRCALYHIHIDRDDVKYLLNWIDNNCATIDSELKKLSLLGIEHITRDVIKQNVTKSKKTVVFELIKAIGSRRFNASMDYLCELLEQGVAPLQIIALLQRNFRILLYMQCGCDISEFRLNKWSINTYKEQSAKFKTDDIINILENLIETERLLKTSSIKEGFLLSMLIFEII